MEKTPFLGAENELQKIYSNLGVMVPVGDLSQGKAPAVQPLPTEVTNDTITFNFNVMSNAEITEISYATDHMDEGTITPKKGKISISFDRNPNDTTYEIGITVTNENGSTSVGQLAEFPIIPNWATADEVLDGNKFIGEDGQESIGTYVAPVLVLETVSITPTTSSQTITPSTGYDGIGTANVSAVTSSIDANITAGNIKKDITILGVTGTLEAGTPQLLQNMVTNPSTGWQIGEHDLDGYTEIGYSAFYGAHITGTVTIPEGVTRIGDSAFQGVRAAFTLPSSLRTIGNSAFESTGNGNSALVIPNGVTTISSYAFTGSSFTSITIPSSVTDLGWGVFQGCFQLQTLVINANITTLSYDIAPDCQALTSVTLPSTLQSFTNGGQFKSCSSLPSINIPASVIDVYANQVFAKCDSLHEIHFLGSKPATNNGGEQFYLFGNYSSWMNDGDEEQRISGAVWDESTGDWNIYGTIYVPSGDSSWDSLESDPTSDPAFEQLLEHGWTLSRE